MDTEQLEKLISALEKNAITVKEIFNDLDSKLKTFDGNNDVWQGKVQEALYENYCDVSKRFPDIVEQLNNYNVFLRNTVDNYKKEEEHIDTSIDINKENLDIN